MLNNSRIFVKFFFSSSLWNGRALWIVSACGPIHVINAATRYSLVCSLRRVTNSKALQTCFHYFQLLARFPDNSIFGGTGTLLVNIGAWTTCTGCPPSFGGSAGMLQSLAELAVDQGWRSNDVVNQTKAIIRTAFWHHVTLWLCTATKTVLVNVNKRYFNPWDGSLKTPVQECEHM